MFDFHSHVLPGLDDGSRDMKTSMKMLNMSYNQGVTKIVASPHFIAGEMNLAIALKAREASYRDVMTEAGQSQVKIPGIILGFEVFISKALLAVKNIKSLCIEGTNTMLIELPFRDWGDGTFQIIEYLTEECGVLPLIAHIERYAGGISQKSYGRLLEKGYYAQVNANSFINRQNVRMLEEMIINGQVHVVGSDAHNLLRCSLMDVAYNHVRSRLGEQYIKYFEENSRILMSSGFDE